MRILVIDAQGGGIGRQLIASLKKEFPEAYIMAVGTNGAAVGNMLKAEPDEAATGENSVVVACRSADFIIGPLGIVIADAMLGEITPLMAQAVGQSRAVRILIPFRNCDNVVVGLENKPAAKLIEDAVAEVHKALQQR